MLIEISLAQKQNYLTSNTHPIQCGGFVNAEKKVVVFRGWENKAIGRQQMEWSGSNTSSMETK